MAGLNSAMNKLFFIQSAGEGGEKFKKEFDPKAPYNQYDQIMGGEVVKPKVDYMGDTNAMNNPDRVASDLIETLYREKVAYEYDENNDDDDDKEKDKDDYDFNHYNKEDKNYNSYDRNNNGLDYIPYAVLGSAAVGLGAYQAYRTGDVSAPFRTVMTGLKKGLTNGFKNIPKNLIGSNKTSRMLMKSIKQSEKTLGRQEQSWSKANKMNFPKLDSKAKGMATVLGGGLIGGLSTAGLMDTIKRNSGNMNSYQPKQFNMNKKASYSKKEFAKVLVKEDFIQNGIRSIPYATVPIALSYALDKNLKSHNESVRGKKNKTDKIVIDVPISSINKTASVSESIEKTLRKAGVKIGKEETKKELKKAKSMKEFAKEDLPRQVVRSASWALFPAAAIALTGRNIRGMGEKNDNSNLPPVEAGKARITIETNGHNNHYDYKMASEILDEMYKIAKDNYSSDVEKNYEKEMTNTSEGDIIKSKKPVYEGLKKEFRKLK